MKNNRTVSGEGETSTGPPVLLQNEGGGGHIRGPLAWGRGVNCAVSRARLGGASTKGFGNFKRKKKRRFFGGAPGSTVYPKEDYGKKGA